MALLRSERDWVVDDARREIGNVLKATRTKRSIPDRLEALPSPTRLMVLASAHLFLLGTAAILKDSSLQILGSLAPRDPDGTLSTLWQVQAGLVALAFPFLLLLIQFARDEEVTALGQSEVLARSSLIRPALEVAVLSLISAGMLSAWFSSDSAVVLGILIIQVPTLSLLLWCYFRALGLLFDRVLLRDRSAELLEEKLESSMEEMWAVQRGNQKLLQALGEVDIQYTFMEPDESDDRWWRIPAECSGQITDIDRKGLVELLRRVPRKAFTARMQTSELTERSDLREADEPVGHIRKLCGTSVTEDETVLLLLRSAFADNSEPRLPVSDVLKVESSDD